eukprot:gnl/MRDRNA2_/MRDRNA2_137682_c0_seq1.p1 gnl/MRDRNA2_/MRDRNA2_137682_c0~~gnl/MRDRNA2_/MRDRNA2_137682_c0_seq1.p1  ORF type:complete len:123 (-),score=21.34 gnl/MRDRNA2_/MRDRNA2_137682_c0_seq1:216-557(-)
MAQEQEIPQASLNMCSAFLHVGADLLRSVTTTVEGVAVLWLGVEGTHADGIATLLVSCTIFAGSCGVITSFLRQGVHRRLPSQDSSASSQNGSGDPVELGLARLPTSDESLRT